MTRWLETDTLDNQNINNDLAVGTYTSNADRLIAVQLFLANVVGNGDYTYYMTHQIGGAGAIYRYIPISTGNVAAGVTNISGAAILVPVRNGDILTVYAIGLAGDNVNAVDIIVRWFEMAALRPITPDREVYVSASGDVSVDQLKQSALADMFNTNSGETEPTSVPGSPVYEIANAITTFPNGAIEFTYTMTDSGTGLPIEGVTVEFSTDNPLVYPPLNIVWKGTTDSFGVARDINLQKPHLDAGTYYVWRHKDGYVFVDPDTEAVS